METKAVIFDCDGMINSETRFSERLSEFVPLEVSLPFFKGEFQECIVGHADLKTELAKKVAEWKWKGTVDDLLALWFSDDANAVNEAFFPLIRDLRERGMGVYLATNNEKYRTDYLMNVRGLGVLFDRVFSSSSVGAKKPQKEFYEYIFERIPETKEQTLYWDDDAEHVSKAREQGIRANLYTTFEDFSAAMST